MSSSALAGMEPRISVLVVASNDSPQLRDCLHRIRDQARPLGAELVLVLNQATAATPPEALRWLGERVDTLEHEPRTGKSHGLNRGVQVCRGEVIAFADDDVVPRPGWLEALTRPLLAPDRPGALVGCGGRVRPIFPDSLPRWYRALLSGAQSHFLGPVHDLGDRPIDYPTPEAEEDKLVGSPPLGANCAYRREVFEKYRFEPELGPNRESGLRGGEDFALGMRLLRDGHRIQYRPDASVDHPVSRERATLDYARRGYFVNGVEEIRLRRLLGLPLPSESALRLRLHKRRRFWHSAWLRLVKPSGRVRRELRRRMAEGMLEELHREPPRDRS